MRHSLLLLACLIPACASSNEKQRQLANFQRTATLYYEGGRFDQAMLQIERGLDVEPDDYKLRSLRGTILLRTSESASGTDHRRLDEATAELAEVYDQRSDRRHEPYLLLYYALARQKQGRRLLGESIRLADQAQRAGAAPDTADKAKAAADKARTELLAARELLDVLVERGDVPRLTRKHLFQVALDLQDEPQADLQAKAYFEQMAKEQEAIQKEIERTPNLAYEREQVRVLGELRAEELEARALMAQLCFEKKDYPLARTMLDRVLELDPSRSVDYYNRGRVLLALGEREAAKTDFRKFLATTDLPATNEKTTIALRALDQ
jgi:tetratricopeptide (TPR) repeat protein